MHFVSYLELTLSWNTCATSPTAARAIWLVASPAVVVAGIATTAVSTDAAAALRIGVVTSPAHFTGEVNRRGCLGRRERVSAAHDDVCRVHRLVCGLWLCLVEEVFVNACFGCLAVEMILQVEG